MIACIGLLRTEVTWRFANTIVSSTRPSCFQRRGCCSYNGLMGNRRKRSAQYCPRTPFNPAGRAVSTSSSNAECSVAKSENIISGETSNHANEGASSMKAIAESTPSSANLQEKPEVKEAEGVLFEATSSPSVLPDTDHTESSEEELDVSAAKHSVSIEVGASLMRFIKGEVRAAQKSIEKHMGVKIIFRYSRIEDSIIIEGDSVESITEASDAIQAIINEVVQSPKLDYSHFISLPLAIHPELVEKLLRFQDTILGMESPDHSDGDASEDESKDHLLEKSKTLSDLGIDKSIFIKPKTFHLTVLMLKLWNKEMIYRAEELLRRIHTKVMDALDGRPLSIRLKGLDCMRGSPSKARVLYAPVVEIGNEDRLMRACQVIIDAYVEAGLVLEKDARHKLKLHATVMNARHRKRVYGTKPLYTFDARGIFEKYGSEEWGEYLISEAHLSERFTFDGNGYYHCCASIPFPRLPVK